MTEIAKNPFQIALSVELESLHHGTYKIERTGVFVFPGNSALSKLWGDINSIAASHDHNPSTRFNVRLCLKPATPPAHEALANLDMFDISIQEHVTREGARELIALTKKFGNLSPQEMLGKVGDFHRSVDNTIQKCKHVNDALPVPPRPL